jgi:hypothetical protein
MTGTSIFANRFNSIDEAKDFFDGFGFSIESHSFTEMIDQLSSMKRLDVTNEFLMKIIGEAVVFKMTVDN